MAEHQPFLKDGSQFGVSRAAFWRMRKRNKLELMMAWFYQNFEDPAERTPYENAEGAYQWIWGGPYKARDMLHQKFGAIVSTRLVEKAARAVEADGIVDWAPAPQREDKHVVASFPPSVVGPIMPPDEPPPLYTFLDEPSAAYGTSLERHARAETRAAVEKLLAALPPPQPAGIGHNRPPDSELEPAERERASIEEVRRATAKLSSEFAKSKPNIAFVKRWATSLRNAIIVAGTWGVRKLDKALDSAITTAGSVAGGASIAMLMAHYPALHHAFDAIVLWLEIAAKSTF